MESVTDRPNAVACSSGSWTVWSLSDGHLDLPASSLIDPTPDEQGPGAPADEPLRLSVNCFLLQRSGQEPVLVDCGAGGAWEDSMGHLGRGFDEAGFSMGEVRTLLFTHAHTDHINGLLTRQGEAAFPNLDRVLIPAGALARFDSDASLARFRPLLRPIEAGAEIMPGLRAVPLPGHAAGHTGYRLDTEEDAVLVCGDIVHVPDRQFSRPELTWTYDDDQVTACETRRRVLEGAAADGTWLAGAHLGRPGIGRVIQDGQGYRFETIGSAAVG